MNNKLSITYFILILTPLVFGCRGPVKEQTSQKPSASAVSLHAANEKYMTVDTKESVVTWTGGMVIGTNTHTGYVYLSKGELLVENGQLVGGTVEVNMNTIEDDKHGKENNLVNHLKDVDFFEVIRFPFSTMVITKVEPLKGTAQKVTGDLTIKGITYPVTFPAKIEVKEGMVKADGKLVIDRTKWGVRYKSGKFYDLLANQAMSDSIALEMKIVAKQ